MARIAEKYITERVKIDKLIPGGQAIGTMTDGKKAMLWNALPGEIVTEFQITKNKSHYLEGIATKIEQDSERRIQPQDDCYLATSPWQIMDYDCELEQKREILLEIFRQHSLEVPEVPLVQTNGHDLFYRNKMEYSLYYSHEDEQIHLAFRNRGTHHKIPVTQSSLERQEIWDQAERIVAKLNAEKADARQYQSLLLRCDKGGKVSGGLLENHQPHPNFTPLEDNLLGHKYSYSPNGFFQINLPVYEMALLEIQKHIHTDKVLDLYAGVGTIGLSVARDRELALVECDKSAYREMENNCQGVPGATPVWAKSEEALSYIQPDQTVILDPPRAGCHAELLNKLLEVCPPVVIYLSCNPATEARDVKILSEQYRIANITPFNFFPRTPHLENLIILTAK